jgi:hypothetical protein
MVVREGRGPLGIHEGGDVSALFGIERYVQSEDESQVLREHVTMVHAFDDC